MPCPARRGQTMKWMRVAAAAAAAAVLWWSCATDKPTEATSEVIYEDSDGGATTEAPPADPFDGCTAQQQQVGASFTCGQTTGAFIQVNQVLSVAATEKTLTDIEARFPPESTRERFTQTYGEWQGQGSRVYEDSPVSPFRSETVLVKVGPKTTRIVSCTQRGSVDPIRCGQITAELVANGIPQKVPGAPPPPTIPTEADLDAGMGDGGMGMDGDAGMDAGTMMRGMDAGTPKKGSKKRAVDAGM
jgi:hypothetical protein